MFLENTIQKEPCGWIEVISGSMFSGKTEELIRRIKRAHIAGLEVKIFKPSTDTRYDHTDVVSHDQSKIPAIAVEKAKEIINLAEDCSVVGIDEAQFFDSEIVEVCNALADSGKRVVVAGLDMDYTGKPFGPMPFLMAVAEYVTKVHAICTKTGSLAHYSYRKSPSENLVELGEKDLYESVSRCVFKDLREKNEL